MALPSFPADDPATREGEDLLGPAESPLRLRLRDAAEAASNGEPAIPATEARRRLSNIPGVANELAALDGAPAEHPDL